MKVPLLLNRLLRALAERIIDMLIPQDDPIGEDDPLVNRLRERAGRIIDTRILQIVLAFMAGGLFVSVAAAVLAAIGEAAES